MKLHVAIVLLLIGNAVGSPLNLSENLESAVGTTIGTVANVTNIEPDIYIEDEHGNLVKIDLSLTGSGKPLVVSELPDVISFYLYTNETGTDPEQLYIGNVEALNNSHFDPSRETKFITHGWRSSSNASSCTLIRDAYLKSGNYNVIVIDWSQLAYYEYVLLAEEMPKIAQCVAYMIDFLIAEGMDPDDTTIVGHSLGGHLAGLSSYYAIEKLSYVVGLDVAKPVFECKNETSRLSKEDGKYVEVIHTTYLIGLFHELGHADFYPNGGLLQPGCIIGEACGHQRAYEYFAESISNNDFPAQKCDNYAEFVAGLCGYNNVAFMGGAFLNVNATGKYYLYTNAEFPYGKKSL